jgi:prolyl oligopeptidase
MHAYKMCAALQYATSSGPSGSSGSSGSSGASGPVLMRAEGQVGHGARAVSRSAELSGDTLAFAARFTGLEIPL